MLAGKPFIAREHRRAGKQQTAESETAGGAGRRGKGRAMGIIEEKWEALFEKYHIREQAEEKGLFYITADQIREFKEPRLMTKFDTRESVPGVFGKLGILPVTRGKYVIGDFRLYQDFPEEGNTALREPGGRGRRGAEAIRRVDSSRLPGYLETIDIRDVRSEAAAIKLMGIAGILEDFLGEERMLETVSGRMASGRFDFQVHSGDGKRLSQISVNNSQVEIDGGFEGRDCFAVVEGKNVVHSNFLVRQLYYPCRLWRQKIRKPVRPVFLVYSNQIFRLLEYEFEDWDVYDSARLVRERRYSLEDTEIRMEELSAVLQAAEEKPEPEKIPFIQADSFDKVISLIEHLGNGALTAQEIAGIFGFKERQSDYYYNACAYLGLAVREKGEDGQRRVRLTPLGRKILSLPYRERQLKLAGQIFEHGIFRELFGVLLRTGQPPDRRYIAGRMRERGLCGESLAERRASSVAGWLRWMRGLTAPSGG